MSTAERHRGLLVWCGSGLAAALALGWIAALLHAVDFAPLGIVSIAIGAALGTLLHVAAATWHRAQGGQVASPARLISGTLLLALVTVVGEHAWLYFNFRRQWYEARANSAKIALFRPTSPWSPSEYFARELSAGRAPLWALDATLIIAAALAVLIVMRHRRPAISPCGRR